MRKIVIFGAGGLGRLVLDTLIQADHYHPAAFLDSDANRHGLDIDGVPVIGGMDRVAELRRSGVDTAIVAIGDMRNRVAVAEQLARRGMALASAIHPLASIAPSAILGNHLIIGARAAVCVHARIGEHAVVLAGCIVEHDNELGEGVFLHPAVRLAGGVKVQDFAVLQIGACVIPYREVGRNSRVAPGAVVIRDVLPGTTVFGVPAVRELSDSTAFVAERPDSVAPAGARRQTVQHPAGT